MTPILLDTAAVIWLATDSPQLTRAARAAFNDPTHSIHVSVISVWEIVIKNALGKLPLPVPPARLLDPWRNRTDILITPLNEQTVLRLANLPPVHRDPFDRMLACQALELTAPIVSPDIIFDGYGIQRIW